MSSARIQKIERLLLKELAAIVHKFQIDYQPNSIITVTIVRISPDLSFAKVYLSLFPPDKVQSVFKMVNDNKKLIRFQLGQAIGKQMRIVPELAFYIDDSLDYLENIENLLKK